MNKNEIVIFETEDRSVTLPVAVEQDTVWLNRNQMAELFDRDVKTIGKHINNALKEELNNEVVVAKFATTTSHGAIEGKTQTHMTEYYNLDVIISVGYRVKSHRGTQFPIWAMGILKEYMKKGYATSIDYDPRAEYDKYKNILDVQVCCLMKNRGDVCCYNLNNKIQEIYNPKNSFNKEEEEIEVKVSTNIKDNKVYKLRIGDKVINTKNNYYYF